MESEVNRNTMDSNNENIKVFLLIDLEFVLDVELG